MFNTISDPLLNIALWTGNVACLLALLLLLQIIFLRYTLIRTTQREQQFVTVWKPLLLTALVSGVPENLPPLPRKEHLFFLRLWVRLLESVRGGNANGVIDLAQHLGIAQIATGLLTRGNRAEQILAILALGHLRATEAWGTLQQPLRSNDATLSFCALRALVQIDAPHVASELTPFILQRKNWPLARVASLLQSEQALFAAPLLQACQQMQGAQLCKTLNLVDAINLSLPAAMIAPWLEQSDDTALLTTALRLAATPQLLPQIRALIGHPDWQVRVLAAKMLGRMGDKTDAERLLALLSDSEWWVRYRAAKALLGLPSLQHADIVAYSEHLADRFARDMLLQVMAEGEAA